MWGWGWGVVIRSRGYTFNCFFLPTQTSRRSRAVLSSGRAVEPRRAKLRPVKERLTESPSTTGKNLNHCTSVILFRLRTGHNRLNAHLLHKLKTGQSQMCPCDTAKMTTEHFLQHCPLHNGLRGNAWSEMTPFRQKLCGDLVELMRATAFLKATGVDVCRKRSTKKTTTPPPLLGHNDRYLLLL